MVVYANGDLEECVGEGIGPFDPCELETGESIITKLANIISQLIGVITIFAGLWFLFQIIYAGFSWLSAGGDPEKISHSRDRITNGFLGLTIVVGALAIMGVIQFFFGIDFLLRNPADLAKQLRGPTPTP